MGGGCLHGDGCLLRRIRYIVVHVVPSVGLNSELCFQTSQVCRHAKYVTFTQTWASVNNVRADVQYLHMCTVYVEIFVGILFCEIVKKLGPQIFGCFHFREYVVCFVLRLVTD